MDLVIKYCEINKERHLFGPNVSRITFNLEKSSYYPNHFKYLYRNELSQTTRSDNYFKKRNDILFFDFYALHPVWSCLKKHYQDRSFDYINKLFEEKCFTFGRIVFNAISHSIDSETKYVFGYYNGKNYGTRKEIRYQFSKNKKIKIGTHPKDVNLQIKKSAFALKKMWHCDFGGHNWKLACDYCIDLRKALDNYDINKTVLLIDKILDLEHNTGHILNKNGDFLFLCGTNSVLDFRRYASLEELSVFSSAKVRNIVNKYSKQLCQK